MLRFLLLFYGVTARMSIFELFKLKLELITQRDIQNILRPLLRTGTYPIRDELVSRIEKFLSPYLSFTTEETDLIRYFYNTGELNITILFPQKEIQERIRISPSLKWKIQNIKQKP